MLRALQKASAVASVMLMTKIIVGAFPNATIIGIVRTTLLSASLPEFVEHGGNQLGKIDAVRTNFTGSVCFECFGNACCRRCSPDFH